jgi:hypothetical protein
MEQDVEYLITNLVGSRKNWLLQRQNKRCLCLESTISPDASFIDIYGLNFDTK